MASSAPEHAGSLILPWNNVALCPTGADQTGGGVHHLVQGHHGERPQAAPRDPRGLRVLRRPGESWVLATSDPGCDGARGGAGARGLCGFVKWQGSSFCSSDSCRCAVLSSDGFDVGFWFFCSWKCLLGLVRNKKLDEIKGSAVLAKDHDADFLIFSYFLLLAYRNLIFKKN